MFVPATISGYSAGLIQQAGTATKEQLPDHAGYCLATATRNRYSGSMTWSHPGRAFANRLGADIMVGAKTGDVPSVRGRIAGR
jgi:hypothetical protein